MRRRTPLALAATFALALVACACGSGQAGPAAQASESNPVTLRLGYFPNVTHAPALVGIKSGYFASALGSSVTLQTSPFNAGPEAVEALFSESIDATFIGPNPAINAYAKSKGEAIRIVAGTTSGGAFLVVKPDIASAADLKGESVASPQLGGTQDVALRSWLLGHGLTTDTAGGGDVSVVPQPNGDTLAAFKSGDIAGAWVPEPWATRLVNEGGGKILVDERDLWPSGRYVTTHLIVAKGFLDRHPDVVKRLIEGLSASIDAIDSDPASAQSATNAAINDATGRALPQELVASSFTNLEFTLDPIASSLIKSAKDAEAVDLLQPIDLTDIYDLTLLNTVLREQGKAEVQGI